MSVKVYGFKPIAMESKAHVFMLPCVSAREYSGDMSLTIIFLIQHNPRGQFVNPTATHFNSLFP